jgi:hypothetical protein
MKTMRPCILRFNIYLIVSLLLVSTSGCHGLGSLSGKGDKKKAKAAAFVELHIEDPYGTSDYTETISVLRDNPTHMTVEKDAFVDTADLASAKVVTGETGMYKLQLKFNDIGTQRIDGFTSRYRGRHIAILCKFPADRWLGALLITKPISNGIVEITPDATQEECDTIVKGLEAVIKKLKEDEPKF